MIQFSEVPYLRPDMDRIRREMEDGIAALKGAKTFEEAYSALLRLETPRCNYATMAALSEIHSSVNTNDPFWAGEEDWFSENGPKFEELGNHMTQAILASPYRADLEKHLGAEPIRRAEMEAKAFSPKILKDMEEENKLSNEYSKLTANLTAELDGKSYTLGELTQLEDETDRDSRKKFDALRQSAFAKETARLDSMFDEMVKVRDGMAKKLGYGSFTEMGFLRQTRTSYQRADLASFRDAIRSEITPVVQKLYAGEQARLGYETLYNYDESAIFAATKLRAKPGKVEDLFVPVFSQLSPETRVFYDDLRRFAFYDTEERKGKARNAYTEYLPTYHMPFVFVNYNATFDEVVTFAHECGHALQSYIKRGEPFMDNTNPSFDLCEIHSMAMEFFIWPYLKDLIPEADIDKYKYLHLKSALSFIPYGTIVDAYQTEVYDHPEKTPAQRREMWQSLEREFLPWKKFDGDGFYAQGRFWQRQTHIYRWPFYYIDYVLAQTCALQYHFMDEEDHEKAWNSYLTLVRESDRCSFSETLEKAGLESPFKPGVLAELGRKAVAELDALAQKAYK